MRFAPSVVAFVRTGLAAFSFLAPLVRLPGATAFVAPLAALWPLGAPFFWLAAFFEGAFSGAVLGACSATVAALSLVSAFVICVVVILFCASFAHDDSSL
jgi:hypothetical protein